MVVACNFKVCVTYAILASSVTILLDISIAMTEDEETKMKLRRTAVRKIFGMIAILTVLTLGVAGSTLLSAPSARAAGSVYVYISLPTWLGNCPSGGSVKYLQVSSWSLSASDYKADFGDDLVYIRVGYRENTQIVSQPYCYNGTRSYTGVPSSQTIYATRNGQTWWLGPWGVQHN